ncbi:MAG: carbohydrate binding domain-containing protein [Bacteroidaceae bacterium]|nr:carbohydrate binding domain-containing protein [Bacteroidaceae bacterium]
MRKLQVKLSIILILISVSFSFAQVNVNIDPRKKGSDISPRMYGIFFEEINHAGDGGLYAELIQNRSFEDNASKPDCWNVVGNCTASISSDIPLNEVNPHCVKVVMKSINTGIKTNGWWGIKVVKGTKYKLTFWTRSGETPYAGNIKAALQSTSGANLGSVTIDNSELSSTTEWKKITAEITATGTDNEGWFALLGTKAGTVYFDMVSLFPPTYKNRENGCRVDLAEMLEAIHPKFLRFPGGCVVEGKGTVEVPNRFEWKKSRGPIEERPGHYNNNWGYPVTDGLGMLEYLQLAEDLGAEPLFVVNMGMGHDWEDPNVDVYIQEALDAIEYCNGDSTTYWGKLRIEDGHPEPFNLKLMEIGNENYWFGPYGTRYGMFYKAISAKYPYIEFVGDGEGIGWGLQWPLNLIDHHFYESPSWFLNSYNKYDSFDRSSSYRVYVGEYAVTKACGSYGNMNAALSEAAFMCGMENNSDVVRMASYAPIFVNEESSGYRWHPDMIRFNNNMSYGTPSYHVQQLMGENVGTKNIKWTIAGNEAENYHTIALSSWSTSVKYDNIVVKSSNQTVYENDFTSTDISNWTKSGSGAVWSVRSGELCQTSATMQGSLLILDDLKLGDNYQLELDATKVSGSEGFLIGFNVQDAQNFIWWNIGGWGNTKHALEQTSGNNRYSVGDQVNGTIVTRQTYHIKIVVNGSNVQCFIDGTLIHNVTIDTAFKQKLYMSASTDEEQGLMYIKVVNPGSESQNTTFNISNAQWTSGEVVSLSSKYGSDENTTSSPRNIVPKVNQLDDLNETSTFVYDVPAYSFQIFRLRYEEIKPEADPNLPTPLISYQFDANGTDDSGTYPYNLKLNSKISLMDDGNRVFWSGPKGYIDLKYTMARDICPLLTSDYAISLDLYIPTETNLSAASWAFSIAMSSVGYMGIIHSGGNNDWSYELKRGTKITSTHSESGLNVGQWNNIVYSQTDSVGTLYVNGYSMATTEVKNNPSDITRPTSVYLAKSSISDVATMSNVYFDNLKIYTQSLSAGNAAYLYQCASQQSTEVSAVDAIPAIEYNAPVLSRYNLQGQQVGPDYRGIIIVDGKKMFVK